MTRSLEDYIEAILLISRKKTVARVKDISEAMDVKKPSVINAIKELQSRGFVQHEKYGYVELTEAGKKVAEKVLKKHIVIKKFLTDFLHVGEENAEKDACSIEHCLSDESWQKLQEYIQKNTTQ